MGEQVFFARSPHALQSPFHDIERYCELSKLKINTTKTKIMIFERGRATYSDFFIYGTKLEIVSNFKYLGLDFFKNGSWSRSQKNIAKRASYALNNLFLIFSNIELPLSQKCKLFDILVSSILQFGSEIIGLHQCNDLELIHTKFLRRILGVNKSTNLSALYGELGRLPLFILLKIRMIKYWIHILNSGEDSLIYKVYKDLMQDVEVSKNNKNWAYNIKTLLQEHGLYDIWLNQFNHDVPFLLIKQRILDMYYQKWHSDINNSPKLKAYCVFKQELVFEKYLDNISVKKYRSALTKFRVSSHNLAIETGRRHAIPQDDRKCLFCPMNSVETEFHFLLVCPFYTEIRRKYFKNYFCRWPTLNKLKLLMNSESNRTQLNIAIYDSMRKRQMSV